MGYSSDDVNKFLWPVRIGGGVFDGSKLIEGLRPKIVEKDYYRDGEHSANSTFCVVTCMYGYVCICMHVKAVRS